MHVRTVIRPEVFLVYAAPKAPCARHQLSRERTANSDCLPRLVASSTRAPVRMGGGEASRSIPQWCSYSLKGTPKMWRTAYSVPCKLSATPYMLGSMPLAQRTRHDVSAKQPHQPADLKHRMGALHPLGAHALFDPSTHVFLQTHQTHTATATREHILRQRLYDVR